MIRAFTLRSLAVRWPRLLGSILIVAFGVGCVTGTLIFTDTTRAVYRSLFTGLDRGAALVVSGRDGGELSSRTVGIVRHTPGVGAAAGQLERPATIVGRDGRPLPSGRLITEAISAASAPIAGQTLIAGGFPHGHDEVAIDARTARQQHWSLGSVVRIVTGLPVRPFLVVGIARQPPAGQRLVIFSLREEQALYLTRSVDRILVAVSGGTPAGTVAASLRDRLGPAAAVRVRGGAVSLDVARASAGFRSLDADLLAFAVVAVLLGALTILGTFSISAAQRARELALLRALGASRSQVLASGLLEGAVVAIIGAGLGLGLGPLISLVIRAGFAGGDFTAPGSGLVVGVHTLAIGAGVGIAVTLLAAAVPAVRATRAAPLAAVRAAASADVLRESRRVRAARALLGVVLTAGGAALMLSASGSDARRLAFCGLGGALLLTGALVFGPLLIRLGTAGWKLVAGHRLGERDAVPELAREQLLTNPGRPALSGATLMVGVALAVSVGVYVGGLRAATQAAIAQSVVGDLAIQSADGNASMPASVVRAAVSVPDATAISTLKRTSAILAGSGPVPVNGIDPTSWGTVYRFSWLAGSSASLGRLTTGEALVESDTARANGLSLGSALHLKVAGGAEVRAQVVGIYRDAGLLHGVTIPLSWFDQLSPVDRLQDVFIRLARFVSRPVAVNALRVALRSFPGVVVHDQAGLAAALRARLSGIVRLLYALLGLTVVMSLIGLGAALTLSVNSRTRELGLLRALGMTPGQARRLVRLEGTLSAAVAAVTGLLVGAAVSAALLRALRVEGFSLVIPWVPLLVALAAAVLVAALATLSPARRAARTDILAAIAYE